MPTPPKTLTLDKFLEYKPKTKIVDVPSLGGKIKVRQALVSDQEYIAGKLGEAPSIEEIRLWLIIRCCVEPALSDEHYEKMQGLPVDTLKEIDEAIEQAAGGKVVDAKSAEKSDLA